MQRNSDIRWQGVVNSEKGRLDKDAVDKYFLTSIKRGIHCGNKFAKRTED